MPLAIHIAANTIRDLNLSFEEYLIILQNNSLLDWLSDEDPMYSVRASFNISYKNLPNEEVKKMFRILGIFHLQESFSLDALTHILSMKSAKVKHTLLILIRRGLIELDKRHNDFFRIHPLMRSYAYELLEQYGEKQITHLAAGRYYHNLISLWDRENESFIYGKIGSIEDSQNGIYSITHYYHANENAICQDILVAIADMMSTQGNQSLLMKWINNLEKITDLHPWLAIYKASYLIESNNEYDKKSGLIILNNLKTHSDLKIISAVIILLSKVKIKERKFQEAENLLNESLNLKQQMRPQDLKGIAYIQNELANINLKFNKSALESFALHKKALEIQKNESDVKGMIYTLSKIASIHINYFKNIETAEELILESEQLAKSSDNKIGLISILIDKARILRKKKYFGKAIDVLYEAYEIASECNELISEAYILKQLGNIYESVELYDNSLKKYKNSYGILIPISQDRAAKLNKKIINVNKKIEKLRKELSDIETAIKQKESMLIKDKSKSLKSELRTMKRRRKRLKQMLGLEHGTIRLGKH